MALRRYLALMLMGVLSAGQVSATTPTPRPPPGPQTSPQRAAPTLAPAAPPQPPVKTPSLPSSSGATPGQARPPASSPATEAQPTLWLLISSDDRKANRTLRLQSPVPAEGLEALLSSDLKAELKRQKIDAKAGVQNARERKPGERLELMRERSGDREVKVVLEPRASSGPGAAGSLRVQLRKGQDGPQTEASLPIDAERTAAALLRELQLNGEKPLQELERLVDLSRMLEEARRVEPAELVVLEAGGSRLVIQSR